MKTYLADLHIHSKFSRATSKSLTPAHLGAWAEIKGLSVIATGDFTHPQWLEMIQDQLEFEASGLFRLKEVPQLDKEVPWLSSPELKGETRFILCTEISSIYKRGGKVRKNHNLVIMPDLDAVHKFNARLAQVGNLASDGRPILGLDAKHLLEMVLETDPRAYLIPAHIWTPWFSLFGSKSGFDSVEECFGDLSKEIFALETGLSSDPEMNWLWSALDRFTLISNSDAHSGEKLAREANIFSGEMSFDGIRSALRKEASATKFEGTLEFYPEEGKYHLDGHRKCNVVFEPVETVRHKGICPVCGKALTVGVLNRIFELSDRQTPVRPPGSPGYESLVPLVEVIGEIQGTGPGSKKVLTQYGKLIREFGSELAILRSIPLDELQKNSRLLAEAIRRMRTGKVYRHSGYDGEFGRISMFSPQELLEFRHGRLLAISTKLSAPQNDTGQAWRKAPKAKPKEKAPSYLPNDLQRSAILAGSGPVLVMAGPGTGKTQTLMGRVRHLLEQGADPQKILILTFTRKAARELQERLHVICPQTAPLPRAETLHALALEYWTDTLGEAPVLLSEESARRVYSAANPQLQGKALKNSWNELSISRERGARIPNDNAKQYLDQKAKWNLVDYTDLLEFWVEQIDAGNIGAAYEHVLVDEVQDLSPLQLELVFRLTAENGNGFFAIGDVNQAIYAFRGAQGDIAGLLEARWPELQRIRLAHSYRSAQQILDFSAKVFKNSDFLIAQSKAAAHLALFEAQTQDQEAKWIASHVRDLLGGTGHWQADAQDTEPLSPGDIAVLVRFKALIPPIERALHQAGIPVSVPEQEAFFSDQRVAVLLRMAGAHLGMPGMEEDSLPTCSEEIIDKGPLAMAVALEETSPFDGLFWKSSPFIELSKAYQRHRSWSELLNMVTLESEFSAIRSRSQKVQIMTMHAAKGLEFDAVFLSGLEEGILPFAGMDMLLGKSGENTVDLEEERRLFYVGLTRARKYVFMSRCLSRKLFGKTLKLGPSSFLRRLPMDMLRKSTLKTHVRRSERQLTLF